MDEKQILTRAKTLGVKAVSPQRNGRKALKASTRGDILRLTVDLLQVLKEANMLQRYVDSKNNRTGEADHRRIQRDATGIKREMFELREKARKYKVGSVSVPLRKALDHNVALLRYSPTQHGPMWVELVADELTDLRDELSTAYANSVKFEIT